MSSSLVYVFPIHTAMDDKRYVCVNNKISFSIKTVCTKWQIINLAFKRSPKIGKLKTVHRFKSKARNPKHLLQL